MFSSAKILTQANKNAKLQVNFTTDAKKILKDLN